MTRSNEYFTVAQALLDAMKIAKNPEQIEGIRLAARQIASAYLASRAGFNVNMFLRNAGVLQ